MRNRSQWIFAAGLIACGVLAAQLPLLANQNEQQDKTKEEQKDDVNIRYAKAYTALMQAEMAKLQDINRTVPGTIRPAVMEAASLAVREAQDRIRLAKKDDEVQDHEIYVSSAKFDLQYAEEALRKAQAANVTFSRTVGDFEIARLKAAVDVAKVRVELANNLQGATPLVQAQYELELLREQMQELRLIVALLRDRN